MFFVPFIFSSLDNTNVTKLEYLETYNSLEGVSLLKARSHARKKMIAGGLKVRLQCERDGVRSQREKENDRFCYYSEREAPFCSIMVPSALGADDTVQVCGLLSFKEKRCIAICSRHFLYLGKMIITRGKNHPPLSWEQVEQHIREKREVALPPE